MKLLVLICLSLQLLVAPVCQAAMSCSQDMAGMSHQIMSGHATHSGHAATDVPAGPGCEHCGDASVLDEKQTLAVLSTFEPAYDMGAAAAFVPRDDTRPWETRAPPDTAHDTSQSVWLRTLRIRL